jgi:hypothetical protein
MEINNLKKELHEKTDRATTERNECLKFNEGSYWMSKHYKLLYLVGRVVSELENFTNNVEELISEFNERLRLKDSDLNGKFLNNSKTWFLDALERMINELNEKFKSWEYNAKKNINI